jgi:hypothetical protein
MARLLRRLLAPGLVSKVNSSCTVAVESFRVYRRYIVSRMKQCCGRELLLWSDRECRMYVWCVRACVRAYIDLESCSAQSYFLLGLLIGLVGKNLNVARLAPVQFTSNPSLSFHEEGKLLVDIGNETVFGYVDRVLLE